MLKNLTVPVAIFVPLGVFTGSNMQWLFEACNQKNNVRSKRHRVVV
jgi:hypothetical protein